MQSDKHTILDVESCAAKATPLPQSPGPDSGDTAGATGIASVP